MVWASVVEADGRAAYRPARLVQGFLEAEPRSFSARLRRDLHVVCDRADDRDPEASLGELLGWDMRLGRIETSTFIGHLDHEPVRVELVADLHDAHMLAGVGVAN